MRCAKCGASSTVKETREKPELFYTRRRRICDNNHRFNTYEVHSPAFSEIGLLKYRAKVSAWRGQVKMYARDLRAWLDHTKHGRTQAEIARELGLKKSAVWDICRRISKDRKDSNAP